jgi:hypothetical protein
VEHQSIHYRALGEESGRGGIEMGLDLRELLLHRGDGVLCAGAHAGCSRSRRGSMHLFPFCAQQSHQYRQAIAEPRTHLDGLAGLRCGLSRLGLGFHIAGQSGRVRLKRGERSGVYGWMEAETRWEETDWGLLDFILSARAGEDGYSSFLQGCVVLHRTRDP